MVVDHYYTEKPISALKKQVLVETLKGLRLKFFTGSSVFSKRQIDKATRLLIENSVIKPNWKILDMGCGYGVIGIALKKIYADYNCKVWMIDINKRAVMLSKENAKLNNVKVCVIHGNLYEPVKNLRTPKNLKFHTIITNPPISAGRAVCYEIIEKAPEYLLKNGLLQLVSRHKKGGAMLEKKMLEVFGNVKTIVKRAGFRVYVSINLKNS